jgi:acyl carrier protein
MEQQLRTIVSTIAETPADFSPGATLRDDLNVDSVRALEVIFEIERTFSIKVPEGRYGEVRTFQDLVKLVTSIKGA